MTATDTGRAHFRFESLTGFFLAHPTQQEDPNYTETHADLGLIPRSYAGEVASEDSGLSNWQRFANHVGRLNREAPDGETYKVLFVTRHGQGYHNVMEAKVGTPAWESKWALLEGDGTVTWADAELTEQGVREAQATGRVYGRLLGAEEQMPWPALYSSPHRRCLHTACLTFEGLAAAHARPFRPLVKEGLRERTGRHTCDRRSPRSWIRAHYPQFRLEPGFAEADELFTPDARESDASHRARAHAALDDIFAAEENPFVSVTMHSHAAMVLMRVIGHEPLRMSPAASMAFLVRATRTSS